MNTYSIPIYGVIGEDVLYTDILLHVHNAQKYDGIKLLIDSPGGLCDEAERMCEAIQNLAKPITTVNTGDVCSAAVDFFMLGNTKAQRIFNPARGVFLIHNPWAEMTGEGAELIEAGKELKKYESETAQRYAIKTGANENIIMQFMAENTPLTPEQIEQLGFATIVTAELKAVAKFNFNYKKMESKEVEKKLSVIEKMMLKVSAILKVKNLVVQDVNGVELDFGSEIIEASEIIVGVSATVGGAQATGEYVMADGSVYVFEAGVLTEIKTAEQPNEEVEALKAEIESLKAQLGEQAQAKAELETVTTEFQTLQKEFKNFRMQFNSEKPDMNVPAGSDKRKKLFI